MNDLLLDLIKKQDDRKILELLEQDSSYNSIKITALMRLKMYNEALLLINSSDKLLRSYCLMKLNRCKEALEVIKDEKGLEELLLKAQVLNRLEQSEALEIYKELEEIEDLDPNLLDDIIANKIGVMASLGLDLQLGVIEGFGTFEQAYNYATLLIGRDDYEEAQRILDIAADILNSYMEEDTELINLVKLQKSVILQNRGYKEEAQKIIDSIQGEDIKDENTNYILKCNVSKKPVVKDLSQVKMTLLQKRISEFNQLLKESKDKSLKTVIDLLDAHGNDENYHKMVVGKVFKEKRRIQEMKKLIQLYPQSKTFNLALVQLYLEDKNFKNAEEVLSLFLKEQSDFFRCRPSIVALRVFLSENQQVLNIFEDALKFWKLRNDTIYRTILEKSAGYKLASKMYQEAAVEYQELLSKDPNNEVFTAGLMTCFAGYDPLKAQGYPLPTFSIPNDLDVDKLEDFSEFLRYVRYLTLGNLLKARENVKEKLNTPKTTILKPLQILVRYI
jgi:hypothetical protein